MPRIYEDAAYQYSLYHDHDHGWSDFQNCKPSQSDHSPNPGLLFPMRPPSNWMNRFRHQLAGHQPLGKSPRGIPPFPRLQQALYASDIRVAGASIYSAYIARPIYQLASPLYGSHEPGFIPVGKDLPFSGFEEHVPPHLQSYHLRHPPRNRCAHHHKPQPQASRRRMGNVIPWGSDVLSTIARTHFRSLSVLQIQYWTVLRAAWLEALLQIPGLQCLDMDLSPCSSLTDDLITQMTSSWPQLEHFRLYSSRGGINLSIHCIQAFARHCPKLLSLSLDLETGDIPGPMAATGLVPLAKLVVFSVSSWSKIHGDEDVDLIEQHLREVLPSLQLAYVERRDWGDYGMERKEDWDFVFDRIYQDLNPVLQEQWTQFQPSFSEWRDSPVAKLTLSEYRKEQEKKSVVSPVAVGS